MPKPSSANDPTNPRHEAGLGMKRDWDSGSWDSCMPFMLSGEAI
jgi:hypothetical protein